MATIKLIILHPRFTLSAIIPILLENVYILREVHMRSL